MKQLFRIRKRELLAQCKVSPLIFDDMIRRLDVFATAYVAFFGARNKGSMPNCIWEV